MVTLLTTEQLLSSAKVHTRLQAGPLAGVPVEPDSPETIERHLSQSERARFDLAAALNNGWPDDVVADAVLEARGPLNNGWPLQAGFTLIELMIVVAIIGILAAIAIPAYEDYVVRSQAMEGVTLAGEVKSAVAEYYATSGSFPADLNAIGMDNGSAPSGKYTKSVTVKDGLIVIAYGGAASDAITKIGDTGLSIAPGITHGGQMVWVCGYAAPPADVVMAADASTSTSIPRKYLPGVCRS